MRRAAEVRRRGERSIAGVTAACNGGFALRRAVTYPFVPDENPAGGQSMTTATHTAPTSPSALLPCAPRPSGGEGTLARTVVAAAAYALVLVVTVRAVGEPLFDPDVWWHLRVGQWLLAV
jgi:hypothetical protein